MTEHQNDESLPGNRSPWGRLILATVIILVLLPCLGLGGGIAYLSARNAGIVSRWRSIGSPPEKGVDILTGDINVVYVRSSSGRIYGCKHEETNKGSDCWFETQEPLEVDSKSQFDNPLFRGTVKPPEGKIVDELDATLWYADAAFETRYLLLEDGTVWKWEFDTPGYGNLFIILCGPVTGLGLGIVLAVLLWAYSGLQRIRRGS